jgi:hypothetical protein
MILRERVGGDGRLNGSASGIGLSFLVLAEATRLRGRPFFGSFGAVKSVLTSWLEECGLCSAAHCKAGGGRERLDSDDDDVHGLSFAAISVEAAGVGGRFGEGMFLEVSLEFERIQPTWLLLSAIAGGRRCVHRHSNRQQEEMKTAWGKLLGKKTR